ncbi:MAG: hypothetical protein QG588_396 [Candidatus Poribacteria bacterium]|nr:hypothetical protein [Candidatus Poribacteria bacterium]
MIKSMTGYGRGEFISESGHLYAEVKSVNSKTCNVLVRLPDVLSSFESQVVTYVKTRIKRGQINISIELNRDGLTSSKKVIIDRELVKDYFNQLESLRDELSLTDPINLINLTNLPGVISLEETKEDIEQIWDTTYQALITAINQCVQTRETEGSAIALDVVEHLESIGQLIERISVRSPMIVEEYRQRLQKKLNDLLQNLITIDESRLATEVAIMADRCDVSEELVRLRSHVLQMQNILQESEEPIGRQLDFILQEINREANTIASKANDLQISSDCIQLKYEIEKVREQVQNIE